MGAVEWMNGQNVYHSSQHVCDEWLYEELQTDEQLISLASTSTSGIVLLAASTLGFVLALYTTLCEYKDLRDGDTSLTVTKWFAFAKIFTLIFEDIVTLILMVIVYQYSAMSLTAQISLIISICMAFLFGSLCCLQAGAGKFEGIEEKHRWTLPCSWVLFLAMVCVFVWIMTQKQEAFDNRFYMADSEFAPQICEWDNEYRGNSFSYATNQSIVRSDLRCDSKFNVYNVTMTECSYYDCEFIMPLGTCMTLDDAGCNVTQEITVCYDYVLLA